MPETRKSNQEPTIIQLIEKIEKSQTELSNKLDTLIGLPNKFDTLNLLVKDLATKLDKQSNVVSALQNEVHELVKKNNDYEQRSREHCFRIWGLKHTAANINDPLEMTSIVYNALKPILEVAKQNKIIDVIPNCFDLIDTAHILPKGKLPDHPIHVRLRSKNYRLMLLKSKKEFFQKSGEKWSIGDELTAINAKLLKFTKNRKDVKSAWPAGIKIKYKKIDDEKVYVADISELPKSSP